MKPIKAYIRVCGKKDTALQILREQYARGEKARKNLKNKKTNLN